MRADRIRPSRPGDLPLLLALWERSVRASHHFLTEQNIVDLRPAVAEELARPTIAWWVLVSDTGVPIGFMGFAHDAIEGLFIDPDHTGAGGGKALIAHAQELAAGCPLTVEVNEQNDAAVSYYASQGFVAVGRTPTDSAGRPFPLIRMRRPSPKRS